MSLQTFKDNMVRYMQRPEGVDSLESFAKKLTIEYDIAIKKGFQTLNQTKLISGNTELCEKLITLALKANLAKTSGQSTIISEIGRGFVGYWSGATMSTFPIPIIPATGALYNILATSSLVLSPGTWSYTSPQIPILDSSIFVSQLVVGIISHLQTVSGLYFTLSAYPGFPIVPPLPGVLPWTGYTIPS